MTQTSTLSKFNTAYELAWLKRWPDFWERPATMEEFLGPNYLNIESTIRQRIREVLIEIFGEEARGDRIAKYSLAMITGGIGIGKTTIASIVIPYMIHWVLCLKNPQEYFGLMPGSRIAFMQMSTNEEQVREVAFGDIKARINHSPWFVKNTRMDPSFKNEIRFDGDIWVIPGDSKETTFEGYNILGGILDEADSHQVTAQKDYAEIGFDTIANRVSSRFDDRGFVLVIGQMKKANGFAARKFAEFSRRDDAYAVSMTIWESRGDDHYRCKKEGPHPERQDLPAGQVCGEVHKFPYDKRRKQVISEELAAVMAGSENIIRIPTIYLREFETNPEKALRDLAGIPPAVGDPFISMPHKIEDARNRWIARHWRDVDDPESLTLQQLAELSPVTADGKVAEWLKPLNTMPRVGHIDIAYSGQGDALGFALGHVAGVLDVEGEMKPVIVIDLLYRIKAPAGGEIYLQAVRQWIYALKEKLGYRHKKLTYDGFESTDTRQQFRRKRYSVEYVSVDRQLAPYYDLRDALYEDRLEIPPYVVHKNPGDTELVEIAVKELSELVDAGKKIEHPPLTGSKDVADAIAGVVYTLMGDRAYRRNVVSLDTHRERRARQQKVAVGSYLSHPAYMGDRGLHAPRPPEWR